MKIIYFSGTGNSYDVADRLGGEMIDVATYYQAFLTKKSSTPVLSVVEDEVVGIVYPVYAADIPDPMKVFLENVNIRASYIFAVATAGANAGHSYQSLQTLLNLRGAKLSYATCFTMPDGDIIFPTPLEKQEKQLNLIPSLIERVLNAVEKRKTIEIVAKRVYPFSTKFMWFFLRYMAGIKFKKVDKSACIKCKVCEGCPVGNILVTEKGVTFKNHCVDCFRCIQICPKNAIRFGFLKRSEKTYYINKNFLARKK